MDFVVFAPNPWHDLWRNRQQIFSRLAARGHRVLYVEPARLSLAAWRRRGVARADLQRTALMEAAPRLWLYRIPAWLPTRATGDRFDQLSDRLLGWHLRRTLRHIGVANPLLWLYRPTGWRWAAATIPHRGLVYHITDDYAAFGHLGETERAALLAEERALLRRADLTLVTAPRLLALKADAAQRIEMVANGVDAAAFSAAPRLPRSHAAAPRLGYSGHISNRLDMALLHTVALARPAWHFVFAGSEWNAGCAEALHRLKTLPNVEFLGLLPVEAVPAFVAGLDVGLIPYRVTDETRAISSLKLYEYLAAGRPVVSADVPTAQAHVEVVHIAQAEAASWIAQIEAALLTSDDPVAMAARRTVAAQNTWEQRVDRIEEVLRDEGMTR